MIEQPVRETNPGQFSGSAVLAGQRWHVIARGEWVAISVHTGAGTNASISVPREVIELARAALDAVERDREAGARDGAAGETLDDPIRGEAT